MFFTVITLYHGMKNNAIEKHNFFLDTLHKLAWSVLVQYARSQVCVTGGLIPLLSVSRGHGGGGVLWANAQYRKSTVHPLHTKTESKKYKPKSNLALNSQKIITIHSNI